MANVETATQLNALQRHLDAQRDSALQLIQRHNQLLAALLQGADIHVHVPVSVTPVIVPATQKGKVVSLFDYKSTSKIEAADPVQTFDSFVFQENDTNAQNTHGEAVQQLLNKYGADDALAINRKHMADFIFMTADKNALFYFKSNAGVMFVVCFVGEDNDYPSALTELKAYADSNELQINLMAQEIRVGDLKANGFTTTPMGIWQRIEPLSTFTTDGQKMRRLRYLVKKYRKSGECKTYEYEPGTKPKTDEEICQVIDQWVELKEQNPAFVPAVKAQIMQGGFASDHRFFLTYRDETLDNVIVLSRDNFNDGYLMDLEFYAKDMPLGSTEFALSQIIEIFKSEGRKVLSLGLTMATDLFEHENGSPDVHNLFAQLRKADYLNGDANAQYKNKYRPQKNTMYLARPADAGKRKLNDLMMILGSAN